MAPDSWCRYGRSDTMRMCISCIEVAAAALAGVAAIGLWWVAVASVVQVGSDCGGILCLDDPRPDSRGSVKFHRLGPWRPYYKGGHSLRTSGGLF